ncbi:hypothetical protein B0H14DRAFT_3478441 [Mycena olivaceomarginata]|nr:hypothetical protein B0H14DRAFT_3478441 [Mycena olivaceomarginata]
MDPEFGEDKFDRLRDEAVPDAILRATDLLETEALGICPRPLKKAKPINHLELFFAGYPLFSYDPHAPVSAQYDALRRLCGFSKCKFEYGGARSERDVAYAGYQREMVLSFGANYGMDVNDLGSLQSAARVLEYMDHAETSPWSIASEPQAEILSRCAGRGIPRPLKKAKPINHLALYFAGYPRFRYDPHAPVSAQCHYGAESERDVAYAGYQRAMVLSSGASYGTDINNLGSLQSLARVLEIDPIPR